MPRIQPQSFIDKEYIERHATPRRKPTTYYVKELDQHLTPEEYKQYRAKFYDGGKHGDKKHGEGGGC